MGKYYLIILVLALFFVACDETEEKEARLAYIHLKAKERITKHKKTKRDNCYKKHLKLASKIADSILIREALLHKDSLSALKPARPDKPFAPAEKELPDSLALEPFFIDSTLILKRDSFLLDSLRRDSINSDIENQ